MLLWYYCVILSYCEFDCCRPPATFNANRPVLLSPDNMAELRSHLPLVSQQHQWFLSYSTQEHGTLLSTMYLRWEDITYQFERKNSNVPSILVVYTSTGKVCVRFPPFLIHPGDDGVSSWIDMWFSTTSCRSRVCTSARVCFCGCSLSVLCECLCQVFGGYASDYWRVHGSSFFGRPDCFVFSFSPDLMVHR